MKRDAQPPEAAGIAPWGDVRGQIQKQDGELNILWSLWDKPRSDSIGADPERGPGFSKEQSSQEIIHKSLNCHSLGKNRLKRKQVTRNKVKGHWVELEARPGSIADCWCCRQMPARARTSSRKTKSPEEKPAKDMRSSHTNWPCNCEFAETELALDKIRLFSFLPGKVLTLYANKSSRKWIFFFQWGKTAMPADPEQTGTLHL